jgi:hypothetical protein
MKFMSRNYFGSKKQYHSRVSFAFHEPQFNEGKETYKVRPFITGHVHYVYVCVFM